MARRKGKIKMWIVIPVILGIVVVVLVEGFLSDVPGRWEIQELTISEVDFKKLHDGVYFSLNCIVCIKLKHLLLLLYTKMYKFALK